MTSMEKVGLLGGNLAFTIEVKYSTLKINTQESITNKV